MKRGYVNKWLTLLLIVAIAFPNGFIGKPLQALAAKKGIVTVDTLNVRMEPSITAEKVQLDGIYVYLTKQETVNILKEEGDFYYVSLKFYGNTIKGYVHKDYVSVDPLQKSTGKPKPAAVEEPEHDAVVISEPDTDIIMDGMKIVELKASVTADSLNVRSGPGTNFSKEGTLSQGDIVSVINKKVVKDEEWYIITFQSEGETKKGYALSSYIKLSLDHSIEGIIGVSSLKIRKATDSKAAYLKYKNGSIVTLKNKINVAIIEETTVCGIKWFKITFKVKKTEYTGYALASKIVFHLMEEDPTPTHLKPPTKSEIPEPSKTPTKSESPEPSKTPNKSKTPAPSDPPKSETPESSNTLIKSETPTPSISPTKSATPAPTITQSAPITPIISPTPTSTTGSSYQQNDSNSNINNVLPPGGPITPDGSAPTPTYDVTNNMDFESKLNIEGFPDSYKEALRILNAQYPNWEFKAYHTGLDWNTVLAGENIPGRNLLLNSKSLEWKSMEEGAYNWATDTFKVFDAPSWVTASKTALAYYMDPRNFFTASGIFQFELLKYQSEYQNLAGVENILKGTAMYNTYYTYIDDSGVSQSISYAQTFIKAAEYSGVSPYHLASRVKQEIVKGPTTLSPSVSGTYRGYEGYYNFYNIGANDSATGGQIANGLNFAKNGSKNPATNLLYMIPWTDPYRAIVGGSYHIKGNFIDRGQDTIYLQKFNVTPTSTYRHQYMTNVEAPYAEAKKVWAAYTGMADTKIVFVIPVYLNMPLIASPIPTGISNANNYMKNLKITDMSGNELAFTPAFSQTNYNYSLNVVNSVDTIQISASAASKKATIIGNGILPLNIGINTAVISVIAEDGSKADYTISIIRE